ncbi:hypothetical protein HYY75_04170 [bacterium]|nr:hypothetical protein [bacterium]
MDSFEVEISEIENVQVFQVKGYFAKDAGMNVLQKAEELLKSGKNRMVLDVSQSKVISSPGVSTILDLTFKVIDDFKGCLVLSGLNDLKTSVLTMSGVIPLAKAAADIQAAVKVAKE